MADDYSDDSEYSERSRTTSDSDLDYTDSESESTDSYIYPWSTSEDDSWADLSSDDVIQKILLKLPTYDPPDSNDDSKSDSYELASQSESLKIYDDRDEYDLEFSYPPRLDMDDNEIHSDDEKGDGKGKEKKKYIKPDENGTLRSQLQGYEPTWYLKSFENFEMYLEDQDFDADNDASDNSCQDDEKLNVTTDGANKNKNKTKNQDKNKQEKDTKTKTKDKTKTKGKAKTETETETETPDTEVIAGDGTESKEKEIKTKPEPEAKSVTPESEQLKQEDTTTTPPTTKPDSNDKTETLPEIKTDGESKPKIETPTTKIEPKYAAGDEPATEKPKNATGGEKTNDKRQSYVDSILSFLCVVFGRCRDIGI